MADLLLSCKTALSGGCSCEQMAALAVLLASQEPLHLPDPLHRQIEQSLGWAQTADQDILPADAADYPDLLKQIPDPPVLLYVQGEKACLSLPQIAMVGSRKPSASGIQLAGRFAAELSACGFRICSGLAYGIDKHSHQGALQAGSQTIAVLGSGHRRLYPRSHRSLAQQISSQGAVISEFAPDSAPKAWHFPMRNRIISGLCYGVLVVEAARASGSLVTARHAADQGRTVFAIPGMIQNQMSRGCHSLIRNGAVLVETLDDILAELGSLLDWERSRLPRSAEISGSTDDSTMLAGLTPMKQKILRQIAYNPRNADALAADLDTEIQTLLPVLLELELAGLLSYQNGSYIRL